MSPLIPSGYQAADVTHDNTVVIVRTLFWLLQWIGGSFVKNVMLAVRGVGGTMLQFSEHTMVHDATV